MKDSLATVQSPVFGRILEPVYGSRIPIIEFVKGSHVFEPGEFYLVRETSLFLLQLLPELLEKVIHIKPVLRPRNGLDARREIAWYGKGYGPQNSRKEFLAFFSEIFEQEIPTQAKTDQSDVIVLSQRDRAAQDVSQIVGGPGVIRTKQTIRLAATPPEIHSHRAPASRPKCFRHAFYVAAL
jgi:hypothetical protein